MAKRKTNSWAADLEDLYLQFLQAYYAEEEREQALKLAGLLEAELVNNPGFAESIRGDEVRSLLSELSGDLTSAIQSRESEIRKIFELHSLVQGTPGWDYVQKQYDYSDIRDRLDLLANLYAQTGNYQRAISVLNESKNFCSSHRIPFEGEGLIKDFKTQFIEPAADPNDLVLDERLLDEAIIDTYKNLNTSSDQILIDDQIGRLFHEEVKRRLPEGMAVSAIAVKSRLLNLRRRGEERGGLPRLIRRA